MAIFFIDCEKMSGIVRVTRRVTSPPPWQALKDSKEVEVLDMKIRRKLEPEKWPLPGLTLPNHTDFSQLINCPEFVPRQPAEDPAGKDVTDRLDRIRRSIGDDGPNNSEVANLDHI